MLFQVDLSLSAPYFLAVFVNLTRAFA